MMAGLASLAYRAACRPTGRSAGRPPSSPISATTGVARSSEESRRGAVVVVRRPVVAPWLRGGRRRCWWWSVTCEISLRPTQVGRTGRQAARPPRRYPVRQWPHSLAPPHTLLPQPPASCCAAGAGRVRGCVADCWPPPAVGPCRMAG